jgi:SAM-dependent methyltransferase
METWIMKALRTFLAVGVVVAALEWSYAGSAEANMPPVRSSIPYVATRNDAVQDMLRMANVGKDDVVYDLGSGDGRIVIAAVRDFGARRAVGIENDPERIRESRENARKAGVTDRVEFIHGDLFTTDFRQASVVTLFLGHQPNIKLRSRIFSILKHGSRIVSHQFNMGEWQPDKTLTVRTVYLGMYGTFFRPFSENPRVPDYTGNELDPPEGDRIFMWVVPAPVAGIWRGKIETAQGPQDCQLILHQRLSNVTGTFQLSGQENLAGGVSVGIDLWGNHVRFEARSSPDLKGDYGQVQVRFDGYVNENTMKGTLVVTDHGKLHEHKWKAQRNKVDYTGTWEWPCATGPRSVRLRIEQHHGRLIATYLDRDQALAVTDFYDCGGGFYFTLLIGREGNSIKVTEDTGWLIGEGILDHGEFKGKIRFYPYGGMSISGERKASQPVIQDWAPRLIKPPRPVP